MKGHHGQKLHGKKKTKQNKTKKNEMTISKDNKKVILLLLKLKDNKIFFHRGFGTFQSFIKFKNKNMRIVKCRKVKYGAYQGGHSVLIAFLLVFM